MKLALFGLLSLLSSATALKMHTPQHMQDPAELVPTGTEVNTIYIQDKIIAKYAKNEDSLDFSEFKRFVKRGGGNNDDAEFIFKELDTNGDGKVSKQELKKLEQVIAQEKTELPPVEANTGQAPAA